MAVLLSTVLSISEMDYHFGMYQEEVRGQHNQELSQLAIRTYAERGGWDEQALQKMEAVSSVLGLQVALYDNRHELIRAWGAGASESSTVDEIPLSREGTSIGYLAVAHHDRSQYQSMEAHFQMAHTTAMQWTMFALMLLVVVISVFLARTLVRPIVQISAAAEKVAKGRLDVQVELPVGRDEISSLVDTFNNLVHSLRYQEELRKRLTSDIAHELRTPLNTLLAQVEAMIDGVWAASPEHLESTRREVLRLSTLVQDLDQVIQVEAGALPMNRSQVYLSRLAGEVIEGMSAAFSRAGIQVDPQLGADVWVSGDRQKLAQVMTNLLHNACKHTDEGGRVIVKVWRKGKTAALQIADNGAGIPGEDLPFVFERFYRGDRARTREKGGTGLGLTIAKGIVEAHEGEITLESEVGRGTSVTITFPAAEPPDRA